MIIVEIVSLITRRPLAFARKPTMGAAEAPGPTAHRTS
jgi:hypothetical protein